MLKKIEIRKSDNIIHAGIIKKKDILNLKKNNSTRDFAKRQAKKIIADAENTANDIKELAWLEGYTAGIAISVQDLAQFVNDNENHKNAIMQNVLSDISTKLEFFFDNNEVIYSMLDSLAKHFHQKNLESPRIIISAPEHSLHHSRKLLDIFANRGLTSEIRKSKNFIISVKYDKEIWTCDIPNISRNFVRLTLDKMAGSTDLLEKCSQNSTSALTNIRNTLDSYLAEMEKSSQQESVS